MGKEPRWTGCSIRSKLLFDAVEMWRYWLRAGVFCILQKTVMCSVACRALVRVIRSGDLHLVTVGVAEIYACPQLGKGFD